MKTKVKTALITGASGKIGRIVAFELACTGYACALQYHRSKKEAHDLAHDIAGFGGHAVLIHADISKTDQCGGLVKSAYQELGHIDVFVHTASEFTKMSLGRITPSQWHESMRVNLESAFFLSQEIGMRMMKGRGGSIVHFSDIAAKKPYVDFLPYCMSKAAIEAMVKGMAARLAPKVRINAIAPYMVRSPKDISAKDRALIRKMPIRRATDPREIARIVLLLADPDLTITGEIITVDGGRGLVW